MGWGCEDAEDGRCWLPFSLGPADEKSCSSTSIASSAMPDRFADRKTSLRKSCTEDGRMQELERGELSGRTNLVDKTVRGIEEEVARKLIIDAENEERRGGS